MLVKGPITKEFIDLKDIDVTYLPIRNKLY
jgi:hypothetical protein